MSQITDFITVNAGDGYDIELTVTENGQVKICLLYTSPSPRDYAASRMPSSA